ncbi:Uncharacterised protein [Mycoplasmopsis gallopavonis]|uniref:Uncharacterized protein n=1 Tax=Mycoplasmopsis gallopavonis TaxID=76629 RepID=A0A449AZG8_9BACT|nr:hypothetical protein [Mycoplasmopsis gallopavonis]VEU72892.1 Uncharacterised protein [Mycoplasmopsis gallopavonis]
MIKNLECIELNINIIDYDKEIKQSSLIQEIKVLKNDVKLKYLKFNDVNLISAIKEFSLEFHLKNLEDFIEIKEKELKEKELKKITKKNSEDWGMSL